MTNSTASLRPAFFELCVNTGRYCQSLSEIDVTRVTNDVELFRWIRRRYKALRDESSRRHRRFWQASAIHFVYFGLEQAGKVHILCNEESFPPDDEVSARRWHLHPSPPKPTGASPMPSNTFIHYLRYCDLDVEVRPAQRTWLDKLPKKLHESMAQQARARGEHVLIEAWACTSSRV